MQFAADGVALRAGSIAAVAGLQFETRLPWIADWGVYYQIGLDGYNVLLVLLTAFLGPLVVAGAFTAIHKDVKLFYAMVFSHAVRDARHVRRAGSVPVLPVLGDDADPDVPHHRHLGRRAAHLRHAQVRAVHGVRQHPDARRRDLSRVLAQATTGVTSFAFADLYRAAAAARRCRRVLARQPSRCRSRSRCRSCRCTRGCPTRTSEAPTAGSVILAGVLLKMGTYGFMKLGFPLFPDATRLLAPVLVTLAVVSIIYGACLALVQTDIKKIIAYSSISHLGYVMLGLVEPRPASASRARSCRW